MDAIAANLHPPANEANAAFADFFARRPLRRLAVFLGYGALFYLGWSFIFGERREEEPGKENWPMFTIPFQKALIPTTADRERILSMEGKLQHVSSMISYEPFHTKMIDQDVEWSHVESYVHNANMNVYDYVDSEFARHQHRHTLLLGVKVACFTNKTMQAASKSPVDAPYSLDNFPKEDKGQGYYDLIAKNEIVKNAATNATQLHRSMRDISYILRKVQNTNSAFWRYRKNPRESELLNQHIKDLLEQLKSLDGSLQRGMLSLKKHRVFWYQIDNNIWALRSIGRLQLMMWKYPEVLEALIGLSANELENWAKGQI